MGVTFFSQVRLLHPCAGFIQRRVKMRLLFYWRDDDVIYGIQHKDGDGEICLFLLLEFQSMPAK